jgi:hypothetical protein
MLANIDGLIADAIYNSTAAIGRLLEETAPPEEAGV